MLFGSASPEDSRDSILDPHFAMPTRAPVLVSVGGNDAQGSHACHTWNNTYVFWRVSMLVLQ